MLAREAKNGDETRSRIVETMILTGHPERYLPPAVLEDLLEMSAGDATRLWDMLAEAASSYVDEMKKANADGEGRHLDPDDTVDF